MQPMCTAVKSIEAAQASRQMCIKTTTVYVSLFALLVHLSLVEPTSVSAGHLLNAASTASYADP